MGKSKLTSTGSPPLCDESPEATSAAEMERIVWSSSIKASWSKDVKESIAGGCLSVRMSERWCCWVVTGIVLRSAWKANGRCSGLGRAVCFMHRIYTLPTRTMGLQKQGSPLLMSIGALLHIKSGKCYKLRPLSHSGFWTMTRSNQHYAAISSVAAISPSVPGSTCGQVVVRNW